MARNFDMQYNKSVPFLAELLDFLNLISYFYPFVKILLKMFYIQEALF